MAPLTISIAAVREFCKSRLFDISYYPGVKESETNIFNKFDEDSFIPQQSDCYHRKEKSSTKHIRFMLNRPRMTGPSFLIFLKLKW